MATAFPPLVEPGPELTLPERERYARHLILRDFGPEAQRRVRAARVLVVGAGGLGSPLLSYLAAAGVGHLTVVDDDVVEVSNLHRQVIHGSSTLGMPKAESAARRLADLTDLVEVDAKVERLDPSNVREYVAACDVVVDGSDNFATRYLVADACEIEGTPLVWGTLDRYRAQVAVFWSAPPAGYEPVGLRDVYPQPPAPGTVPSCGEAGILGALTGQVGSLMAMQALWLITGVAEPVLGRLVLIDSLSTSQRSLRVTADPDRKRATALAPAVGGESCEVSLAGTPAGDGSAVTEIGVAEVSRRLGSPGTVLLDVREAGERAVAAIEPSIWVPLGELGAALDDPTSPLSRALGAGEHVVVYCKAGARSANAAKQMIDRGADAERVESMAGGIDAWSDEIDPTLPRY